MLVAASTFGQVALAQQRTAPADDGSHWEVIVSPYTLHWHRDEAHRHVLLLGLERAQPDGTLWGGALFRNSFGQATGYAYYGHVWEGLFDQPSLYAKLTGGILYGYRGRYKDKVPFNHGGVSPALIPAIGWRLTPRDAVQVAALGKAGVTFSYNRRF
ncbi:hypothetical protein AX767_03995 [Variovorax sp. PAMC 28711]|nr:hypothetical protein AX767_03995 [Variovorax sp. PAMC 28711]